MKRNILNGILLIGALALGSCSTTKLASNQAKQDDDVYFSNAKAGDAPVYVANTQDNNNNNQNLYNNYNDDDYYYYNSYSSRINRFGYYSPFGYYDDIYTGYNPYYGYSSPYYGGFSLGYGYGSYGYSPYYGYNSYGYGYNPYSFFGTGYGYGGGWGIYSAYGGSSLASTSPRPYRGSGAPTNAMVSRSVNGIGYNGNYPVNASYPGRPNAIGSSNGRQAVNSTPNNNTNNNNNRPVRGNTPQVYTPQPQVQSAPPPSSSGGNSSSGSSGASSSGGGSSRPIRP